MPEGVWNTTAGSASEAPRLCPMKRGLGMEWALDARRGSDVGWTGVWGAKLINASKRIEIGIRTPHARVLHTTPLSHMPSPLPRRNRWVPASFASPTAAAFPVMQAGRLPHRPFRGLLSVHCTLRPVRSRSPLRTLYTRSFDRFVTSTAVPIATGWNDSCRVGFAPTKVVHLCTAHCILRFTTCSTWVVIWSKQITTAN